MKENNNTPLMRAIKTNDVFTAKRLLNDADACARTTSLIYSIYLGNYDICKLLIKAGANCGLSYPLPSPDKGMCSTPFMDVLRRRYFDLAEMIESRGYNIHSQLASPLVLYEAAHVANFKWKKMLLNSLMFKSLSKAEVQSMAFSACADDDVEILNALIKMGLYVNFQDDLGNTIFHQACYEFSYGAASVLLKQNPDIYMINSFGMNALHALYSGSPIVPDEPPVRYKFLTHTPRTDLMYRIKGEYLQAQLAKLTHQIKDFSRHSANNNVVPLILQKTRTEKDFEEVFERKSEASELGDSIRAKIASFKNVINITDNDGNTALHLAMDAIDDNELENLLKLGADPNIQNKDGKTPFHLIRLPSHAALLIKYGANINIFDKNLLSPLEAVINDQPGFDNYDVFFSTETAPLIHKDHILSVTEKCMVGPNFPASLVKYLFKISKNIVNEDYFDQKFFTLISEDNQQWLIQRFIDTGCDIHQRDRDNNSLLHLVCNEKYDPKSDIIKILVQSGIDANNKNNLGFTPLQEVFYKSMPDELRCQIMRELIENGADLELTDPHNRNILHYIGYKHVLGELLPLIDQSLGKQLINIFDKFDMAPLHCFFDNYFSSSDGHEKLLGIAKLFFDWGADPNLKISEVPLTFLIKNSSDEEEKVKYLKLLITYGCDLNQKDNFNRSFLHLAAFYNSCGLIEALVGMGLSKQDNDVFGKAPIDYLMNGTSEHTCQNKNCQSFEKLMVENLNVNAIVDGSGVTPLIAAVSTFSFPHALKLIELGANVHHRDKLGLDAIAYACITGWYDTFKVLIDNGSKIDNLYPNDDTLLHLSAMGGDKDIVMYLLQNAPYQIDIQNGFGFTPFSIAVFSTQMGVMDL